MLRFEHGDRRADIVDGAVSLYLRVSGEWVWLPMPDNPVTLESARQWCEEGGAET